MRIGKPKSKRTPVRLRHKIEKASAAKQRKNRKEAKKNPQWRSRIKKDPGIPNLFPYKAKLLAEMEEAKRLKQEEQQRKREIAKAQRQGTTVEATEALAAQDEDELLDEEDDVELTEDMDVQNDSNPMAALLASAQARAQNYDEEDGDDEDEESGDEDDEWQGIKSDAPKRAGTAQVKAVKVLPQKVIADPIPTVTALVERMQRTQDGLQRMLDFYQIPPLVTTGSDLTSRFLVEVARKTGRLGRGGVPNLHSAGLTVLADLNEDRLQLPAAEAASAKKQQAGIDKGTVQVVSQMAQPFRIEGLWEDEVDSTGGVAVQEEMTIEP